MNSGGALGTGPAHTNGTRVLARPADGGQGHTGPLIHELTDTRHDLADPGLQCRPGNVVERYGKQVPVNPDWWYPAPSDEATRELAIRLCRRCPARERCLEVGKETARHYGPAGVWGGEWFGSGDSRKARSA